MGSVLSVAKKILPTAPSTPSMTNSLDCNEIGERKDGTKAVQWRRKEMPAVGHSRFAKGDDHER